MPGSLSKPPLSAAPPPHRARASIRDAGTYTKTRDSEAVKATRVQTVAFDAKCNHKNALYGRHATRFWAHRLGTLPGTHDAFSLGLFRKLEENETRRRFFRPS